MNKLGYRFDPNELTDFETDYLCLIGRTIEECKIKDKNEHIRKQNRANKSRKR